jgi:predicted acetyltransferase
MSSELRAPADDDEVAAWFATEAIGFGGFTVPAFVEHERTVLPRDRMVGIWEGGRCIGVAGSYPFELTVPGGAAVPVVGVCDVAVLPTHRRRGHLTRMMRRLHDDARERGDAAAVLTASDGSIYSRFGYGVATSELHWELDARAELSDPPQLDLTGELRLGVDGAEAMAELWDRCRPLRAGTLSRSVAWWRAVLGPFEGWKGGGTVFTLVLSDRQGELRGGVAYRLTPGVERGVQAWTVEPLDVVTDDPKVEAQLWIELGRLDHVTRLAPRVRPVDDPLRWRLTDPRQLKVKALVDLLWLCPLDVACLLAARTYGTETSLVLAVEDPFDPEVAGTYRLDTGATGAACTRVDDVVAPDLRLGADALGAVSLGGTGVAALAAAGRIEECRPGALAAADAAFRTPLAPSNSTFF